MIDDQAVFRVSWTQGNGYRCTCCRQTWESEEDFDSRESAIEFIKEMKRKQTNPTKSEQRNDEDDTSDIRLATVTEEESF